MLKVSPLKSSKISEGLHWLRRIQGWNGAKSAPKTKEHHMNSTSTFLGLAAAAVLLASGGQSYAQYQAVGEDGIAASPKVRQFLNEKKAAATATSTTVSSTTSIDERIAASPKVRQMLDERRTVMSAPSGSVAGYRATGDDGITASPKVRQQLNERGSQFMVAPVK